MKKIIAACAVAVCLIPGFASAKELKIGFVDAQRLAQEAPQAKKAAERISSEFEPRQKELLDAQKQLRDREERFMKDSAFMSAAEKQKKERDLVAAQRELRLKETEFKEDLALRNNDETGKMWEALRNTIQSYGKAEGYDLILYDGVSYASDAVNITDEILKKLNKK